MTVFRVWASRRGVVIAAAGAGSSNRHPERLHRRGHTLVRLPGRAEADGLGAQPLRKLLESVPRRIVAVTLAVATLLTVYSFVLYLYRNRALFSDRAR